MTNSFALFFVLSRHGDFKLAKGNVLLSYLAEATRVNHSPIYLFPTSLVSLVMVCTKLLLKRYDLNFSLPLDRSKQPQIEKKKVISERLLLRFLG